MTETNKRPLMVYPTPEQHGDWENEAEEMDMSKSEWVQAMVEAGRKKFDARVTPDETAAELREQRNDLKDELDHARDRIEKLEEQLHRGEQGEILDFIEENPGASYGEIGQHIADTVPERLTRHLDELEGKELTVRDDGYYLTEED